MIILGLFVDDMVISHTVEDESEWLELKGKLMEKYELTDIGEARVILGMRITKHGGYIYVDQQQYVKGKLDEFGMSECIAAHTPGDVNARKNDRVGVVDRNEYLQIVGSLIYADRASRPDITHATNIVCRHMGNPTANTDNAAKKILRYLSGTVKYALRYRNDESVYADEVSVVGYSDASWGDDKEDGRSTTGYCVYINNNLISWNSRKQQTAAASSTEAELMAMFEVWKEVKWMCMLLGEMGCKVRKPATLICDNQSSIAIAKHDRDHERTKHMNIKYCLVRDEIKRGEIDVKWVASKDQIADIFTKTITPHFFFQHREKLVHEMNMNESGERK